MRLTPALVRACDILDVVAVSAEPPRVAEVAKVLDLPRNSVYELINTLAARKLVYLDANGRLSLGLHLFELGNHYARTLDMVSEARRVVNEVVMACNETTQVGVLDGRHVVYLIKEDGTQPVQILSAVGRSIPAHCTAIGKAILAFEPRDDTLRRLKGAKLEATTSNTITDLKDLLAEFDRAVGQGFTTDNEELSKGVCCVGAPVRDAHGNVVAGISIAAPCLRVNSARRRELARIVVSAAERLSRRLGYGSALNPS